MLPRALPRRAPPQKPGVLDGELISSGVLAWSCSAEQQRSELLEAAAPRQPLVCRAWGLVIDVLDAGLRQLIAERLRSGSFYRSDSEEQDLHFAVECWGVSEHA